MLGQILGMRVTSGGIPLGIPAPTAPKFDTAYDALEKRIDSLELACAGLWQLLKTKHGYTDEELVRVISEVDARDGAVDGRMQNTGQLCPHCGRQMLTKARGKCLWCGAELAKAPF